MTFVPGRSVIISITQAYVCVVTTLSVHNLSTGNIVRIHVPKNFGMVPLNNGLFSITVLSPTSFSLQYSQTPPSVNVNSLNYPAFTIPVNPQFTAEAIAAGTGATPVTATAPQVLNNICFSEVNDATRNIAVSNQPY
jgi:hypothetical protein